MNKPRLTGLTLKLAAMAAATLPVFAVMPGAAAAPREPAAAVMALTCSTDTDGYWGHAHCKNNTNVVTAFRGRPRRLEDAEAWRVRRVERPLLRRHGRRQCGLGRRVRRRVVGLIARQRDVAMPKIHGDIACRSPAG